MIKTTEKLDFIISFLKYCFKNCQQLISVKRYYERWGMRLVEILFKKYFIVFLKNMIF